MVFPSRTNPAIDHLLLRLRPINRALRAAVARRSQAAPPRAEGAVAEKRALLYMTSEHATALLDDVDDLVCGTERQPERNVAGLTEQELLIESAHCQAAAEASGWPLPLDLL